MDHNISDHELREAVAALDYISGHSSLQELDQLLAGAYAERRRDDQESGWQRGQRADFLGAHLARLTGLNGLDKERCLAAARETLVGSRARMVINTIVDFARRLMSERPKHRRRKGAA
jgi:hypothetical protein